MDGIPIDLTSELRQGEIDFVVSLYYLLKYGGIHVLYYLIY